MATRSLKTSARSTLGCVAAAEGAARSCATVVAGAASGALFRSRRKRSYSSSTNPRTAASQAAQNASASDSSSAAGARMARRRRSASLTTGTPPMPSELNALRSDATSLPVRVRQATAPRSEAFNAFFESFVSASSAPHSTTVRTPSE